MSGPSLLFIHGWGFGSGFWDPLRTALGNRPGEAADLGYFGASCTPKPQGPVLVVAHSLGVMQALRDPPPGCIGMVAINGFDRFGAAPGFPGVPRRVIDRMLAKMDENPAEVVADFRRRCGSGPVSGSFNAGRLAEDLLLLRDGDERDRSACWPWPLLALHGDRDPILAPAHRRILFRDAPHLGRDSHPEAGHLLPLSHPDWCARHIRTMLSELRVGDP